MPTKEYSNGEVTVIWKPDLCVHSENCFKGLPEVFNPNQRPWVNIKGSDTDTIIKQVKRCPSGALSYRMEGNEQSTQSIQDEQIVEVTKNGPLMVHGNIRVKLPDGSEESKDRVTAFCRCGSSQNKPFCDGSHKKGGFKG